MRRIKRQKKRVLVRAKARTARHLIRAGGEPAADSTAMRKVLYSWLQIPESRKSQREAEERAALTRSSPPARTAGST